MIITLILLGVVTFMAIAFLALSRRERGAVTTVTDTATARLAADAALANAEGQVVANALATTNPYNFGLLVSTNYINANGFVSGSADPTNVNYQYSTGSNIFGPDFLQNLANLYYSPRPPVFIVTNQLTGGNDFRYYLDLNRNGRFESNGWVANLDNSGIIILDGSGFAVTNIQVGDPEWIGVLQRPDQPYGPNNPFVARYAFIAVPVGNTLDLNAIHNQTMTKAVNSDAASHASDGFFRNQGVGSWEINLAAFLTDLNTNQWDISTDPYAYLQPNNANTGRGFEDALSLLSHRYNYNYGTLAPVGGPTPPGLFTTATLFPPFQNNIDVYSDWNPPMTTPAGINVSGQDVTFSWAGADNTNHFFAPEELFNSNEVSALFVNSLLAAGNTNSTYDRYTFYRLLSQLGTDSTPESGRMNINYDNLNPYFNGVLDTNNGVASSTNFATWQPLAFFTNAADRLLRTYTSRWRSSDPTNFATEFYSVTDFSPMISNPSLWTNYPAFGIGNIPVLVSNRFVYSSAVNRLLQLAANMYDATANRTYIGATTYPYLPSVFRPFFNKVTTSTSTNVYICGFSEVTNVNEADLPLSVPFNLENQRDLATLVTNVPNHINVYGVPLIIGAKKGFPNFNEFALQSVFQLSRKLQVTRPNTNTPASSQAFQVNQMFNISISNQLGVDFWNSYSNNYPRPVAIYVTNYLYVTLTNDELFGTNLFWALSGYIPPFANWPGYGNIIQPNLSSFQIPLNTNLTVITNSTYIFNSGGTPFLTNPPAAAYESNVVVNGSSYPQPHWMMTMTNLIQAFMVDTLSGRIIDYVQLNGPNSVRDLSMEIQTNYDKPPPDPNLLAYYELWDTNLNNGVPVGVANQIDVSAGISAYGFSSANGSWAQGGTKDSEIDGFSAFFVGSPASDSSANFGIYYTTNAQQVPFTPTARVVQQISWEANDPLVHYLPSDLNWSGANTWGVTPNPNGMAGSLNLRYMPWGGYPGTQPNSSTSDFNAANAWNTAIKDPLVTSSDFWDFPTNKFPTVGWLGRVHRGTPWQTVYLKAPDVLAEMDSFGSNIGTNNWAQQWTGDTQLTYGQYFDAANTAPVLDRLLFDLFTTAFNDNASRGTLSVNVGPTNANLAAWSALFSGVVVPTNTIGGYTIIQSAGSAGSSSLLGGLVVDINATRATFTNADGLAGTFEHVGDILATPELTVSNQWILLNNSDTVNGISDEMYEWLPQQTLSLMRCSSSPRYVIYCYGQTLKPAPDSVYNAGGPYFGMITNYQVVSEIATRAVVRFDSMVTNVVTFTNGINADGVYVTNWFSVPVVTNNNAVIESFNILPPD